MPTYFVTGCTRGLGLEFARQLSARGDDVLATARDPDRVGELGSFPVRVVGLDVADRWSIENLSDPTGETPIDVLINNAGVSSTSKTLAECDHDELLRVFAINSVAPVMVAKSLLGNLRLGARRVIVNISSQLGSITNNTGGSSYGYRASKAALNMFTTCMANQLKTEGFTCVALHPGWVKTDMGGPDAPLTPPQSVRQILAVIDRLTPADNGKFLSYDGKPISW